MRLLTCTKTGRWSRHDTRTAAIHEAIRTGMTDYVIELQP